MLTLRLFGEIYSMNHTHGLTTQHDLLIAQTSILTTVHHKNLKLAAEIRNGKGK